MLKINAFKPMLGTQGGAPKILGCFGFPLFSNEYCGFDDIKWVKFFISSLASSINQCVRGLDYRCMRQCQQGTAQSGCENPD